MTRQEMTTLIGSVISCASMSMPLDEVRDILSWIVHEDKLWLGIEESTKRGIAMSQEIAEKHGIIKKPNAH